LVRYSRAGNEGVLALKVTCDEDGVISIRSLRSAPMDTRNLTLRAGTAVDGLREKKVAVVGVGAVGSHVADSLARSGVGTIAVVDSDIVKPGNLIRHVAGTGDIGWSKADAVAHVIMRALYNQSAVIPISAQLLVSGDAEYLLENFDLVVDATADGKATALLHHAAEVAGKHIVSVCLKEDGNVVRLDILPPISGPPLAATPESMRDPAAYVYEAGCGDPVSMTPHFAVLEAAAIAARHAIGLLTGAPLDLAGEVRDYR
jgi:molybdopterin/thiamine biosynthesis adenylyltransferase